MLGVKIGSERDKRSYRQAGRQEHARARATKSSSTYMHIIRSMALELWAEQKAYQIKLPKFEFTKRTYCVIESALFACSLALSHTSTATSKKSYADDDNNNNVNNQNGDDAAGFEVTTFSQTIKRSLQSYDRSLLEIVFISICMQHT